MGQFVERLVYQADISDVRRKLAEMHGAVSGVQGDHDQRLGMMSRAWDGFKGAAGASIAMLGRIGIAAGAGLGAAGIWALKSAGDAQQTRIAFEGVLGSASKADKFLREMKDFAAKTPFEFPELKSAAQQLLGVGFAAESVIPVMTKIGNAAAALGVSGEGVNGVVRALGQMKGKGKASAEELNQISEAMPGFSGIGAIAKSMGISTAEAFKLLEKGAVPADKAITALLEGMEKFPGAAGAMDRQSRTLNGVISTFKDTIRNTVDGALEQYLPAIATTIEKMAPRVGVALGRIIDGIARFVELTVAAVGAFRDVGAGGAEFAEVIDAMLGNTGRFNGLVSRVGNTLTLLARAAMSAAGFLRDHLGEALTFVGILFAGLKIAAFHGRIMGLVASFKAAGSAVAFFGGPVTLTVVAVAALAAAAVYAYRHFDGFRDVVDRVAGFLRATVLPVLKDVAAVLVDGVGQAVAWLSEHVGPKLEQFGRTAGAGLAAAFGWLARVWPQVQAVLGAGVEWLVANVLPIYARVGAAIVDGLGAAIRWVVAAWPKILDVVGAAFGWIMDNVVPVVAGIATAIIGHLGNVVGWVVEIFPRFVEALGNIVGFLSAVLTPVVAVIGAVIGAALAVVRTVIDVFVAFVSAAWRAWGDDILNIAQTIWSTICQVVNAAIDIVRNIIELGINLITGNWGAAWDNILGILRGVWDLIWGLLEGAWGLIKSGLAIFVGAIQVIWETGWAAVTGALGLAWSAITGILSAAFGLVKAIITTELNIVRTVWDAIWGGIATFFSGIWSGITGGLSTALGAVGTMITAAVGVWRGLLNGVKGAFAAPFNWVIENVINKFLGGVENIAGKLNVNLNLPRVPSIPEFHEGGVVGQGGRPRNLGTNPLRSDEEIAVLRHGEHVLTEEQAKQQRHGAAVVDRSGIQSRNPSTSREHVLTKNQVKQQRYGEAAVDRSTGQPLSALAAASRHPDTVTHIGGPLGFVGDVAANVAGGVRDMIASTVRPAIEAAMRLMDSTIGRFGAPGQIAAGAARKLGGTVLDWIGGVDKKAAAAGFGGGGNIVEAGKRIQAMGFHVSEHPAFGGVNGGHAPNSYHYRNRAIDVNWYPASQEMGKLDALNAQIRASGAPVAELLWRVPNHYNHLHLAMGDGGVVSKPTYALIGERYETEIVTPEKLLRDIVRNEGGRGRGDIRLDVRVDAPIHVDATGVSAHDVAGLVADGVAAGLAEALEGIESLLEAV